MLNEKQEKALKKLVHVFHKNHIPFMVIGGLAAIDWGAKRDLVDIDLCIPKAYLPKVKSLLKSYAVEPLRHYETGHWDIYQMMFNIDGVTIDICQLEEFYVLSKHKKFHLSPYTKRAVIKHVLDIDVPTLPKEDLIKMKKLLKRPVDITDLKYLQHS